jgi:hypothetical protein
MSTLYHGYLMALDECKALGTELYTEYKNQQLLLYSFRKLIIISYTLTSCMFLKTIEIVLIMLSIGLIMYQPLQYLSLKAVFKIH